MKGLVRLMGVILQKKNIMMKKAKKIIKHSSRQRFRSKFERDTALSLRREGVDFEYETMKIKFKRLCVYTPDFIFPNGVIIEAKRIEVPIITFFIIENFIKVIAQIAGICAGTLINYLGSKHWVFRAY